MWRSVASPMLSLLTRLSVERVLVVEILCALFVCLETHVKFNFLYECIILMYKYITKGLTVSRLHGNIALRTSAHMRLWQEQLLSTPKPAG